MSNVEYQFNEETGGFDEVGTNPEYEAGYEDGYAAAIDHDLAEVRTENARLRKALAATFAWIQKHGHIDNHGHRHEKSACAECKVVNDMEREVPAVEAQSHPKEES